MVAPKVNHERRRHSLQALQKAAEDISLNLYLTRFAEIGVRAEKRLLQILGSVLTNIAEKGAPDKRLNAALTTGRNQSYLWGVSLLFNGVIGIYASANVINYD